MAANKPLLILGGLLAAGSIALPGCGATRGETRATSGWSALVFPWRNSTAESESPDDPPEAPPFDPSLRSSESASVADDPAEYYQPRSTPPYSRQPIVPPPAPPANEPGFFESELETRENGATTLSQPVSPTPPTAEPNRLRDLFDSVRRRRPAPPPQKIPLDGPVAQSREPSGARTVGFDIPEPVTLGRPEFVR